MIAPSKSIGRKRLMALGDYVDKKRRSPKWRKFFRMASWYSFWRGPVLTLKIKSGQPVPINGSCGTAACLLGHAPSVPMLRRAGVGNVFNGLGVAFTFKGEQVMASELYVRLFGYLAYYNRYGDPRDWLDLIFTEAGYPGREIEKVTPAMAVRQLRKVVKQIDKANGWDI